MIKSCASEIAALKWWLPHSPSESSPFRPARFSLRRAFLQLLPAAKRKMMKTLDKLINALVESISNKDVERRQVFVRAVVETERKVTREQAL